VMLQRGIFQSLARMGLPAFMIHSVVRYSGRAMKNVKNIRVRTWGPIGLGPPECSEEGRWGCMLGRSSYRPDMSDAIQRRYLASFVCVGVKRDAACLGYVEANGECLRRGIKFPQSRLRRYSG
jgi:hypothetical protein